MTQSTGLATDAGSVQSLKSSREELIVKGECGDCCGPGCADSFLAEAVKDVKLVSDHFDWVGIYFLKNGVLELGPYIGAKTEHTRIAIGTGVCGTAVAEDRDINVPDVHAVQNYLACSLETRSELVVLVRDLEGKILGQIDIDSHTPGAFGAREEQAVKAVAKKLGVIWSEHVSPSKSRL